MWRPPPGISAEQMYERGVPAEGPVETWRRNSPLPSTPDLLQSLPSELRDEIYDLALPDPAFDGAVNIHLIDQHFTTEPPLLRTAKYIRTEAGRVYYSRRPFCIDLSFDRIRLHYFDRALLGILRDFGADPFKAGFSFRVHVPRLQDPWPLLPLVELVRQTGMVLLPPCKRPLVGSSVNRLTYLAYQTALEHEEHEMTTPYLLLLGLTAHREGMDQPDFVVQMSKFCAALCRGWSRGRVDFRWNSIELVVAKICRMSESGVEWEILYWLLLRGQGGGS